MDISNTIAIVRDEGLSPAQSPNTRLVASARACGFDWGQKNPFMDSIEELKDGGIKRTVTFVMDGAQVVPFMWATREDGRLVAKEEEINFDTFRSRYTNMEWVEANPDHPISYLRVGHRAHGQMLKKIKTLPQHSIIRKGKRIGAIPTNASDEDRNKALKFLGK